MVLASTSDLMVERAPQNGCHPFLYAPGGVPLASCLSGKLSKVSKWVWLRLLRIKQQPGLLGEMPDCRFGTRYMSLEILYQKAKKLLRLLGLFQKNSGSNLNWLPLIKDRIKQHQKELQWVEKVLKSRVHGLTDLDKDLDKDQWLPIWTTRDESESYKKPPE